MRILFIGCVEFSAFTLQKLIEMNKNIVGVCTKRQSEFNSDFVDLAPICSRHNIPFKYVKNINSTKNVQWIANCQPDIIFCFGWSSLIKTELLNLTDEGVVGFHPANLPQNRGRHPIVWTLALGLEESATTFFFMDEMADSGDILSQMKFVVAPSDDANDVYKKVVSNALCQIETFVPQLKNRTYRRIPQDDSYANYWRKRGKRDGQIDFRMSSKAICDLVRSLTHPYCGAHITTENGDILVWNIKALSYDVQNIEPGKVLKIHNNDILVKTMDGAVWLTDHDFDVLPEVGAYL